MATAQVQEAAQKVLLDNKRLRALLAKKGVPAAEVEAFLRGHDYHDASPPSLPTPGQVDEDNVQSQPALSVGLQSRGEMLLASKTTDGHATTDSPPSLRMDIKVKSAYKPTEKGGHTVSSNDAEPLRPRIQMEKDVNFRSSPSNLQEPGSDCYCSDIEPAAPQFHGSETECSIAANILAGYQGHGDIEQARAELGCRDSARCSITNAALLHALDTGHPSDT